MVDYEYRMAAAVIIFYYVLFTTLVLIGQARAEDLGVTNPSGLEGFLTLMTKNPYDDASFPSLLYIGLIITPGIVIGSMMTLNVVRGR